MNFYLVPTYSVPFSTVNDFINEFDLAGETCNAALKAYQVGLHAWYSRLEAEDGLHEFNLTMFAGVDMVGMARVTPNPTWVGNGMIGYYIRPTKRGLGYGKELVEFILEFCRSHDLTEITACVDETNERSLSLLTGAGFAATGASYAWRPKPAPRTAIELKLRL